MRNVLSRFLIGGGIAAGLGLASLPAEAGMASHAVLGSADASIKVIQAGDDYYRHRHHPHGPGVHRFRRHRPGPNFFFEFGARPFYRPFYRPAPIIVVPPIYAAPPAYRVPPRTMLSPQHVNWCYARYRSYRAFDNTFQPYGGPRRPCVSPFWR